MISELQITKGGANHEPTERVSSPFPNSFFVPSLSFLPLLLLSSFFSSSSFFSFFASFNKSRASSSSLSPFTSFFLQSSFFSPNLPFPFFSFPLASIHRPRSLEIIITVMIIKAGTQRDVCTSLDGNDGKTASHGVGRKKEGRTHLPPGSHRNSSSLLVRLPPFRVSSFPPSRGGAANIAHRS